MNRMIKMLMALSIIVAIGTNASALVIADGTVTTGQTIMQSATLGGTVTSVPVHVGGYVQAGDAIAHLALEQVYAPCDGTIETIFAGLGENAGIATEKYGGALTLAPESRYIIYATAENAYSSLRTMQIHSGQTVYMKCTSNGTHRGIGQITKINGEIFTIQTTGGEFYNGETAYVYMEDDYDSANRIGKATVLATSVEYVSAQGDIARMHVEEGAFVEKGQLLFETLGAVDEDTTETALYATADGYLTAIYAAENQTLSKDDLLVEICPIENLIISAQIPETEITAISPGDTVSITVDLPEETLRLIGQVAEISYLPTEGEITSYEVRIAFEADARIMPGMQASLSIE